MIPAARDPLQMTKIMMTSKEMFCVGCDEAPEEQKRLTEFGG